MKIEREIWLLEKLPSGEFIEALYVISKTTFLSTKKMKETFSDAVSSTRTKL